MKTISDFWNNLNRWFKNFKSSENIAEEKQEEMKKFLIVGLGNPGPEYKYTRHNIGFLVADQLAEKIKAPFKTGRYADVASGSYRGKKVVIIKPNTYMNLSGKAVRYWMDKEKIDKENVIVITDDVNLDFGTLRIRAKGRDGGAYRRK